MRGASTVTWLAASALLAACATQAPAPLTPRVAMQPIALTQEGADPYRWIICVAGQDCRRPTAKRVAMPLQQSRPQVTPEPLRLAGEVETKPATAPDPELFAQTQTIVVNFPINSSVLDAIAKRALDELRTVGESTVEVQGYTDSTGSDEYNAWLAARRAQRVREYVIRAGVDPEQIRMEAMGECCFVASNGTPEGRSANRRVEVVINGR